MRPLAEDKTSRAPSTLSNLPSLDSDDRPDIVDYRPTDEEQIELKRVLNRFSEMDDKRKYREADWNLYQRAWESRIYNNGLLSLPGQAGNEGFKLSILQAVIEFYKGEANKRPAMFNINSSGVTEQRNLNVVKRVWDYCFDKYGARAELDRGDYRCALFGTEIQKVGYDQKSRIIEDISDWDKDGMPVWEKKLEKKSEIYIRSVDIRNFWIDDKAEKWDDAIDCIERVLMPFADFQNLKFNKFFKNIEAVGQGGGQNYYDSFFVAGEPNKKDIVDIKMYYCKNPSRVIYVANDQIVIRSHPLTNPRHELPFAVRPFFANPGTIYGRGFGELVTTCQSALNSLLSLYIERVFKSNQETFLMGGGVTFDGEQFMFSDRILKFAGKLSPENFQQMSGKPADNTLVGMIDQIFKFMAVMTGVDVTQIFGNPSQTAYQTAVQGELAVKRINNVLSQRDFAYEKLADLYLDHIRYFFPRKRVMGLIGLTEDMQEKPHKTEFPKVDFGDKKLTESGELTPKDIFDKGKITVDDLFEVTPETIRGDFKVEVTTNYNQPTLIAHQQENLKQYVQLVTQIGQVAPEALQSLKTSYEAILENAQEVYNIKGIIDPESPDNLRKQAKKQLLSKALKMMGTEMPQDPTSIAQMPADLPQGPQQAPQAPTDPVPENPLTTNPK